MSDIIERLQAQLDRLDRSKSASIEEGASLCADLRDLLQDALRALAQGELRKPSQMAQALDPLGWFVEKYLPDSDLSLADIAREVSTVLGVLRLAAEATAIPAYEAQLKDRHLSVAPRSVIQVLFESTQDESEHLTIEEIQGRSGVLLTYALVEQILLQLHELGLVHRTPWPGAEDDPVYFHALTEAGLAMCTRVGIVAPRTAPQSSPFYPSQQASLETPPSPESRRPIVAFASTYGGVGTSLALAHVVPLLRQRLPTDRILVIDLDLERQDAERLLGASSMTTNPSPGVLGLLLEFEEDDLRGAAFRAALDSAVVQLPSSDSASAGRVSFLPAGVLEQAAKERALALLRDGIEQLLAQDESSTLYRFVLELRQAIHRSFEVTLVDTPPAAKDPHPAYLGAVLLADSLALFVRPFASDERSLRAILTSFFASDPLLRRRPCTSVVPVLSGLDMTTEEEAVEWYASRIGTPDLIAPTPGYVPRSPIRIYHNGALARGRVLPELVRQAPPFSASYNSYSALAEWISSFAKFPYLSNLPELVSTYFGKDASEMEREIARGTVIGLPCEYMHPVAKLAHQMFADEWQPQLEELKKKLFASWKRRADVLERGRRAGGKPVGTAGDSVAPKTDRGN